jgi:hypothetical protein
MNQNIDIKELWNKKAAPIPDIEELLERTKRYQRQKLKSLLLTNLILLLTCAFIIFVWTYYQPQFLTTKIGIIIIISSIVIYLVVYNRMLPLLFSANRQQSNNAYLQNLLKLKTRQRFLLHTMLNVYFVLLSAGLFLYQYEYTSRMTLFWGIVTYCIVIFWIGLNWFYFRPRSARKQEEKLDALISKFQSMSNQFNSDF